MTYYRRSFQKYIVTDGRARRKEYWLFVLWTHLVALAALLITLLFDPKCPIPLDQCPMSAGPGYFMEIWARMWMFYPLVTLWWLATIIPMTTLTIRRLHDTGRGAGWIFIGLWPIVGPLWLLILMIVPGEKGENRFGKDPIEEGLSAK